MSNLVILSRQCLFVTRNFPTLRQAVNVRPHILPCQNIRIPDVSKRFQSVNVTNDPPLCADPDVNRKIEFIKLELESFRDRGHRVPSVDSLTQLHWDELLKCRNATSRKKYYNFLFITEMKKENTKIKKQEKAKSYLAFKEQQVTDDNPHITYSLSKTSMMLRINDKTINTWRNTRLIRAMQFGEKIIFDCSYDQHMSKHEANSAAKQLMMSFAENRRHKDPFDLHFCNVNFNATTFNKLERFIPTLRSPTFPINLHEGSYLDVFPKEQLVYLTPHCRNDLTVYDPDSIYIIGAMVDKHNHEPLSLIKAKELNLKMARLPLDRYLNWGMGDKTLTLDQMMKIMLSIKSTGNWGTALTHVPKRKIFNEEIDSSKSKANFRNKIRNFEYDSNSARGEQSTLSVVEQFRREIETDRTLKKNFQNEDRNFDYSNSTRDEQNTLTAEKFNRKVKTELKFKKNVRNEDRNFDYALDEQSTLSIAEKFKRKIVTESETENKLVNKFGSKNSQTKK